MQSKSAILNFTYLLILVFNIHILNFTCVFLYRVSRTLFDKLGTTVEEGHPLVGEGHSCMDLAQEGQNVVVGSYLKSVKFLQIQMQIHLQIRLQIQNY